MTQTDIAIQMAADLAACSVVDAFGEDIPNAQTAWDFINEQVYCEDGIKRPVHLPDTMTHSFGPLYLVAAAKLINRPQFYECGICGAHHNASWDGDCRENGARFQTEDLDAKYGTDGWVEVPMPGTEDDSDPIQRLIRAVVAGMEYDPGHSDLDDEQPIHVRMTLGDYRLACRLQAPEYRVTFLSENGTRCTLGNQGHLTAEAAAKIAAANNEECPSAECRVERV